ncbi:uncharacterized protein A4U43_C04F7690 [Asparagus officinalis]|uniref:Serine-threonine/tyrosine-protein kinase catalytic domain-containing protein n=1 Tax=Asparagus officinalis TaxID=4686 RepID=A0A5P1F3J2_ASPOF|nr:uncharacterized protein A4U43_C04F7690 [Asparagus officinalis]
MRSSQDFHPDYIMVAGSSRIGMAYHAVLPDGSVLTVKRLYGCLLSEKQFRVEMRRMGQIRNSNLVPLLGYSVVEEEKLLIYKHMANGALSSMIRDRARAMLLDEEYEPRVTDFGLARLMRPWTSDEGLNMTPFLNGDFGEFGYIAPEYATNPVVRGRLERVVGVLGGGERAGFQRLRRRGQSLEMGARRRRKEERGTGDVGVAGGRVDGGGRRRDGVGGRRVLSVK